MLRTFLGLSEDTTNKGKTEKERQQEYETKRVRRIVPSWKAEFTWLITDDSHGKLFCKVCRSVYGPLATPRHKISDKFKRYSLGPFVVGSCNLRHDSLVTHEKSDGHRYAPEYESSLNARTTQAEKALQCLNSAFFEKLDKLFRVAHSIAKKSRPISDFEWICELEDQLKIDIGTAYRNVKSCKQFLFAIADVERGKIEKELSKANFCSIMSDGSTDVSGVENEIVYIHFAVGGVTHCYFVGMIETPCANARGIYCSIMDALDFDRLTKEEIQQKIVAFAGDGASVNTGKLNGVIALFQNRISPSIIMIQCMAHRVELGMKDAMNKVPLFKKVMELLDDMFRFYKSAKQKSELKLEELGLPCTMPTRIGGTRWVGHTLLAVRNMLKGYKGLVTHLTKVAGV